LSDRKDNKPDSAAANTPGARVRIRLQRKNNGPALRRANRYRPRAITAANQTGHITVSAPTSSKRHGGDGSVTRASSLRPVGTKKQGAVQPQEEVVSRNVH